MSDLIVYSCITGGRDRVREYEDARPGVSYVMFTDAVPPYIMGSHIEFRSLSPHMPPGLDPARQAMWHRWHPHKLFPEGALTLWLDGNYRTKADPRGYFYGFTGDPLFIRHPYRQDCYEEAQEHINIGRYDTDRIHSQMAFYGRQGYASGQGLVMTGFIGRRVPRASDRQMVGFFEETFAHVRRWSVRDQLAVNYCAWRFGVPIAAHPSMTEANFFEDEPHARETS